MTMHYSLFAEHRRYRTTLTLMNCWKKLKLCSVTLFKLEKIKKTKPTDSPYVLQSNMNFDQSRVSKCNGDIVRYLVSYMTTQPENSA